MARMMIDNSNNGGGAEAEEKGGSGLKKGPWTAEEDEILVEYVRRRGEGNWNAVQKNTGLARCGKSCRLRWANHLRPNLKKGAFSSQEEKIIIELHAKLGNKWARMASQLPGRTDNEIKNYWNTRVKRRQRAGLPLYPIELLQQEQPQQQVQENHQITQNSHSSSSSSFSSLLSQNRPDLSLYNNFSHPTMNQLSYNNVALPINCQLPQFQPNIAHALPNTPSFQCNPGGTFGTFRSMLTGPPYDPLGRLMQELPSTQTPASLDASGGAADAGLWGRAEISSSTTAARDQYYDFLSQEWRLAGNSGLLDDLLEEARALSTRKQRNDVSYEVEEKGKSVSREESVKKEEDDDDGGVQSESVLKNSCETSTFSSCDQSSVGIGPSGDRLDVSSMDDDLMSLLNYFPTSMPVPDWYPGGGGGGSGYNLSDRETSVITSGFARHDLVNVVPQNASSVQVAKQPELELLLEQCAWPRLRKY